MTREIRTARKVRRAGHTMRQHPTRRVLYTYTRGIRDGLAVAPQPGDEVSQLLASVIFPDNPEPIRARWPKAGSIEPTRDIGAPSR